MAPPSLLTTDNTDNPSPSPLPTHDNFHLRSYASHLASVTPSAQSSFATLSSTSQDSHYMAYDTSINSFSNISLSPRTLSRNNADRNMQTLKTTEPRHSYFTFSKVHYDVENPTAMLSIPLPVVPPSIPTLSILSISYLSVLALATFVYFSTYSHKLFKFYPVLFTDSRGLFSYDLSFEAPICTEMFYPPGRNLRLLWILSSMTFSSCVSFALVMRVLLVSFLTCHVGVAILLCTRILLFRRKLMLENIHDWIRASTLYALIIFMHVYSDKQQKRKTDPKAM